jgi:hypothetical protein
MRSEEEQTAKVNSRQPELGALIHRMLIADRFSARLFAVYCLLLAPI